MDTNNIEAAFEEFDESAFEQLTGEIPEKQQPPIVGGSQVEDEDEEEEEKPEDKPKESKKTKSKSESKEEKPKEKTDEDASADIDGALDTTATTDTTTTDDGTSSLLEAKYKGLVERGVWQEVELPEDFEWSDETYGEIAVKQAEWKAEEVFESMLDKTGDYGKTIFQHIKNGGNPDDIIELFKEARKIETLDISTDEGQKQIIRDYYKKEMRWTDAKITRFINASIDSSSLEEEAREVKNLLEESVKEQLEETKRQQEEFQKQQKALEAQFSENITKAVTSRKDVTEKERKEILSDLLKYDKPFGNRKVNQFTVDFMKMQADPQKYIDLVLFVRNPEKYIQKISTEKEKEVTKKTWEFIKGSGSLKKGTGTTHTKTSKSEGDLKIDWRKDFF